MTTCGSCGGVIGSDFWAGTACACVSREFRTGAAIHEALLEGWDFCFVQSRATVSASAVRAITEVERTPFPDDVIIWLEHPPADVRALLRNVIAEMDRPWPLEEMKSSREDYDRRIGEAYRLQAAHYAADKLFVSTPLPDKHRYGPHATDPYAPGNRRRRR